FITQPRKDSGSTSELTGGCYAPMWLTVWEMQARLSLTSPSIRGTRSQACRKLSYPFASTWSTCMVFFNMNICRNNTQDIRQLTEYAHDHRIATDYHINETPMLEQDEHFKHLSDNPTYIRPEDWPEIDLLVDWLIQKNKAGYQMVNSVQRLQEIKAFIRMASGADLKRLGWNGDGSGGNGNIAKGLVETAGIVQDANGELHFAEWNCRAGQN